MEDFFATDSWRDSDPADIDDDLDFGADADLGAGKDGQDEPRQRQAERAEAPPIDERLEQVSCTAAYNMNTYVFADNAADRASAFNNIREIFDNEYARGGQQAVDRLFSAMQQYTENGGAGGLLVTSAMGTNFQRNTWTLSLHEGANAGGPQRRHYIVLPFPARR